MVYFCEKCDKSIAHNGSRCSSCEPLVLTTMTASEDLFAAGVISALEKAAEKRFKSGNQSTYERMYHACFGE